MSAEDRRITQQMERIAAQMERMGARIAERRRVLAISQEEVIRRVNKLADTDLGRTSASTWENGHSEPNLRVICALAHVLGTRPEYLAFGVNCVPRPATSSRPARTQYAPHAREVKTHIFAAPVRGGPWQHWGSYDVGADLREELSDVALSEMMATTVASTADPVSILLVLNSGLPIKLPLPSAG